MNSRTGHFSYVPVIVSMLVAFLLTSLPLPDSLQPYRPDWVLLVLVYWCLAWPERIGITVGWVVGLLLDVMHGSLLGQNALALVTISYIAHIMHLRMRMFPLWQQSMIVLFMVLLHLGIGAWVRGITGGFMLDWQYWMPAVVSAAIWPLIFVVLRDMRRQRMRG